MILDADQLATFHKDGVIAIPDLFSREEVDAITARLPKLFAERCPENFRDRPEHQHHRDFTPVQVLDSPFLAERVSSS